MQGMYLMNVYSIVNEQVGIEPHIYLPHGFGQKTKHQNQKNFQKIKKARRTPSTGMCNIKMGKKTETYDFSVIGLYEHISGSKQRIKVICTFSGRLQERK